MTALPANDYVNNSARTTGEQKAALNDIVKFIRERGGAGSGWVSLASGATVDLGAQTGRMYSLTGGTGVTSFGTTAPGDSFPFLIKAAARTTITRGSSLLVQGLANNSEVLTLEIDDIIGVVWEGSNVWRVHVLSRASGLPMTVPMGMRNRLINGDFRIDQRNSGGSITITAGAALAYGLDRWYLACTGANATAQRTVTSGKYRLLVSGASGVTGTTVGQRIEAVNVTDLAGKRASLAVDIQAVSSLTTVNYAVYYANTADTFGTIASPARTSITSGSFTVSTTETRYTVPNISIPSGATTGIEIVFSTGALGSGLGYYLGDVQFEPGSYCTPFERRHHSIELEMCQAYFEPGSQPAYYNSALVAAGGTTGYGTVYFKVQKRAVPTIAGGSWQYYAGASGSGYSPTFTSVTVDRFSHQLTGGGNYSGEVGTGTWTADAEMRT